MSRPRRSDRRCPPHHWLVAPSPEFRSLFPARCRKCGASALFRLHPREREPDPETARARRLFLAWEALLRRIEWGSGGELPLSRFRRRRTP